MAATEASPASTEDVLKRVEAENVEFIRFWFTDILGQLKSFAVGRDELGSAFEDGMGFDGSSITGFNRIEESDMIAMPDPGTFRILPWRREILEGLLTQDDFSYEGTTCSFGPATAVPRSLQQPHPPIWVAARSPDTIAWALKRGYNLLTTPWRDPFSRIQKHHEQVMQIAAAVGVTKPPKLAVSRMTYVGATDGDALGSR